MNPKENRYTTEHEWIRVDSGNTSKIGITDYAQSALGDIVYLDLPEQGTEVRQSQKIGEIESVKAVTDLYSPASGRILEVNQAVVNEPNLVNEDPYGKGWIMMLELSNPTEINALMSSDDYDKLVIELGK